MNWRGIVVDIVYRPRARRLNRFPQNHDGKALNGSSRASLAVGGRSSP